MKQIIKLSASCALALSISQAVDLGTINIESSTIDDRYEMKQTEVSNTAVITRDEVEKINAKSVADILKKVPGLTMSLVGTDSLKIHIRGIDNQMYMGEKPGVAIVIDGVAVQETSGKINVDLDNIESIKVIKGGASYLYGNDALAGAVIITTKKPKGISGSKIESEVGSFGTKRLLASTNQGFENSSLQLQGSLRETDGYWDDAYVKTKSFNGKYQYYIDEMSDITFGADYTKRETGDGNSVSGITDATNDPKSTSQYSYSGYYDSDLLKTFVTYSKTFEDDSNMMLRLHSYEDDKEYKTARATKDKSEIWDQMGAKGEYTKPFDKFAFMLGFDVQVNNTDETTYDTVDGDAPRGGADGDLLEQYETKETIKAVYTELKYLATDKLTTTLNLRHDAIAHKYEDDLDSGNNVSPDYNNTSYRLGANYIINDSMSLYSSVSTGFRTPTVGQISQNQTSLADDPTLDIPSTIDSETTYNYELGLRGKTNYFTYDAALYQLDRKDYIGRIAGSYITSDDEEESNYDNVGDMRSRGFELTINSNLTDTLSFDLAYTYLQAKFKNYTISQQQTEDPDGPYRPLTAEYANVDLSGNYVPRSPKHTMNLTMNYEAINHLIISPEIEFRGSYYADEANQFKQSGYSLVNLNMEYKYSKSLEFFGQINNLLDRNYYEFVNVNSSTLATMEDATIRVGEPRSYYAGLRYKF